jgi:glycosyltransferase involved in cell wall biosynthesis
MLERAIACFTYQSYMPKQLIIVYEEADLSTRSYIESLTSNPDIKIVSILDNQHKFTLGELRNISVQQADGEYACIWDDDDWYSSDRLKIQMKYLQEAGKQASVLLRLIIYDVLAQKSYLSYARPWEGSLLCRKTLLESYPYPAQARGEDTPVVEKLVAEGYVELIRREPGVYVYHYHGRNTWNELHFKKMIHASIELPNETNRLIIKRITHLG